MPDDQNDQNQQQQQTGGDPGQQQQQQQTGPAFSTMAEGPVRDLMTAKAYDSYDKVAEAYYNLNRLHSGAGDVIALPGKDATPEAMKEFFTKVNNPPADASGYDIKFDEGVQVDEEFLGAAKGWFHEAGLRADQASFLAGKYNEFGQAFAEKMQAASVAKNETDVTNLKAKYEAQGKGAYDQFIANGQKAVQALGLEGEHLARLDAANGVAANLELLAIIGAKLGTEARDLDGAGGGFTGTTPEQARVELAKLDADASFTDSLMNPTHPMHQINSRKRAELQKVAYGKGNR